MKPGYTSLRRRGNSSIGGMVNMMVFVQAYLKAARLNHPETYARIQAQPNTIAYMQQAWAVAEGVLAGAYPYTTQADPIGGYESINLQSLIDAYSPSLLAELDALGIKHLPSNAWDGTYFKH